MFSAQHRTHQGSVSEHVEVSQFCVDLAAQCSTRCQHPLSLLCQDFFLHQISERWDWPQILAPGDTRIPNLTEVHLPKHSARWIEAASRQFDPAVCFRSRQMFCLINMRAWGRERCHRPYTVYPGATALNNCLALT